MNQYNKRESNNEKVITWRWFIIILQETKNFNENNEKKKDEKDIKKVNRSDLSEN